jgi:1-deoxy-D-xylulose-5-phosphate synthase
MKPFFAVYCTFLQRAFDQCFQESSLQGLPVRLCLDRAGLVGGDGAVHHGFCDVSLLRVLPKAAITAAIDEPSMKAALEFMRTYDTGLSSCRWPRDMVSDKLAGQACPPFVLGKARCLTADFDIGGRGNNGIGVPDVAVLAFGTPAIDALTAAATLTDYCRVCVYDARFAKPIDNDLVGRLIEHRVPIITVEDHSIIGGFGAAVVEAATDLGLDTSAVSRLALPDSWIYQDSRAKQLAQASIDAAGIAKAVRAAIETHGDAAKRSDVQVRVGGLSANR